MKNISILLTALVLIILASCNNTQKPTSDAATVHAAAYPMLDSTRILDYDVIKSFQPSPAAVVYARQFYMEAIDLLANKKSPKASLPLFIQSIRLSPEAFTYLKYADALYATDSFSLAINAYVISEQLKDEYRGEASRGMARCYSMIKDTESVFNTLDQALRTFPFTKKEITEDPAFSKFIGMERFDLLVDQYLENPASRTSKLLAMFSTNFPKKNLPYSIQPDSLNVTNGQNIDYRYSDIIEQLRDGQFSRAVEKDYQYVATIPLSPAYRTFVYRAVDFVEDTINPVYYYLATVDTTGKMIAHGDIGCFCSPIRLKTFAIDSDGVAEIKEIKQTWRDNPEDKGYANNVVIKQEVKKTSYLQVLPDGTIKQLSARPSKGNATAAQ